MNTLYFDCAMGAAGDMLMAALFELSPDQAAFLRDFSRLQLPGITLTPRQVTSCGIPGTHMEVLIDGAEETEHNHGHSHSALQVQQILENLPVSPGVRTHASAVYALIAQAESTVHGISVEQIHFHEVGTLDAIADVVGVCMLLEQLAPAQILCSPIHVGNGHVHCAHGRLPVPAPATQQLLQDIPYVSGPVAGELCTPTGAALLRHFVGQFTAKPAFSQPQTGRGVGSKTFAVANVLTALLGDVPG